jgi:hypothetical protein
MPKRSTVLAFLDDEVGADLEADLRSAVEAAAVAHAWAIGPPTFVDEVADGLRTVGCVLEIYATRDDEGTELSYPSDRESLADTKALIASLAPVSGRHHIDIGIELDGRALAGWCRANPTVC